MPAVATRQDQLARILGRSGGLRICEQFLPWRGLVTLTYHRIGTPEGSQLDWNLWSADAESFDTQMQSLKRYFDVVSLQDLPQVFQSLSRRFARRQRFVLITFDDGYRDNFEVAHPILKEHGIPATFFISTGFIDRPSLAWWDEIAWMLRSSVCTKINLKFVCELNPSIARSASTIDEEFGCRNNDSVERTIGHLLSVAYGLTTQSRNELLNRLAEATGSGRAPAALSRDLWMNWDMIRTMRSEGMHFGAHTVTHPVLSRLTAEEQNAEICESRLRLEAELGQSITSFSYPVGRRDCFNDATKQALHANSFDWAFSYHGGFSRSAQTDRFEIPRVGIERDMDQLAIRSCTALPYLFAR